MKPESLTTTQYYEHFAEAGCDLRLMQESLAKMNIPQDIIDHFESMPSATLLVLGSASPRNINNVALIDQVIRPGRGHEDGVLMIDYNNYPMASQSKAWEAARPVAQSDEQREFLPYPEFVFAQADMRQLPIGDESMDVVVSDYTLNFLDEYDDVQQTLAEVSRVLKPGGILLFSVAGHEGIDPAIPMTELQDVTPQERTRMLGTVTVQYPQQYYLQAAISNGLSIRGTDTIATTLTCGLLQKAY